MGTKETTNSKVKDINLETTIEQGKIQQLIGYLENSNKVKGFNRYYSDKDEWDYYYSLTGFIKGDYFAITLYSCENKKTVRISPVTDCIDATEELLKKFKIQPTEKWYSQEAEKAIEINKNQEKMYSEKEVSELVDMLQKCKEYFLLKTDLKSEERADAIGQVLEQFKKK